MTLATSDGHAQQMEQSETAQIMFTKSLPSAVLSPLSFGHGWCCETKNIEREMRV